MFFVLYRILNPFVLNKVRIEHLNFAIEKKNHKTQLTFHMEVITDHRHLLMPHAWPLPHIPLFSSIPLFLFFPLFCPPPRNMTSGGPTESLGGSVRRPPSRHEGGGRRLRRSRSHLSPGLHGRRRSRLRRRRRRQRRRRRSRRPLPASIEMPRQTNRNSCFI